MRKAQSNPWTGLPLAVCVTIQVSQVFRQGQLAFSFIQRRVDLDAWVSDSSANTASVLPDCTVHSYIKGKITL